MNKNVQIDLPSPQVRPFSPIIIVLPNNENLENSEQQSVENGQNDLNSRNASEFCKESLVSNKTPTNIENQTSVAKTFFVQK